MPAPIKKHYLKGRKWRQVRLFDLALLLHALHVAAEDDNIGHNDAQSTVEYLDKRLNKEAWVEPEHLESCLYAASMLCEQDKWWHPKAPAGENEKKEFFKAWVKRVLGADNWNPTYNLIEEKDNV